MEPTEPYWWVYGLKNDSRGKPIWYPLYCYDNVLRARKIFNIIIDLDVLPPELEEFEDFKLAQDEDKDGYFAKKESRAVKQARQEAKVKKPAKGKIIKKKARR